MGRTQSRRLLARRATAFLATGGLLAYMALEGGSYDVVVRQKIALVVWTVVALGFGLGVLPRARHHRLAWVPFGAAVGLVAWMGLSLVWTQSNERTTEELARYLGYLGLVTLAMTGLNRHTFRAAAAGLSTAAMAVVGVAVFSRLSPSTFPQALDATHAFGHLDRLTYPLDYWNAVGTWSAMAATVALAWSAHARFWPLRIANLAFIPAAASTAYLTYSRGAILAIAAGLVAVLLLSRNRWTAFVHSIAAAAGSALVIVVIRSHDEIANATGSAGSNAVELALVGAALICAGAVVLTAVLRADDARLPPEIPAWAVRVGVAILLIGTLAAAHGTISRAWHDFQTKDAPNASSSDPAARLTTAGGNRDDIWNFAIETFGNHPLTGVGPGTFEFSWEAKGDDPEYVRDAHSLYLEFLAELGIVGLVLLLGVLGGGLATALAARSRLESASDSGALTAMIGAFLVFAVSAGVDWMWEETAVGMFGLGSLAIAASGGATRLRRERRHGQVVSRGVRTATVVAAIAAAAGQVPGLVSTQRARDSAAAIAAGDLRGARELADDAVSAEPWSATAHSRLAIALRDNGNLHGAIREIQTAIESEPQNWRWPLILAPLQAAAGDRRAAIATFAHGRTLGPSLEFYSPFSYYGEQVYTPDQLRRIAARAAGDPAAQTE